MLALQLTEIKDFMNTLLRTETFDHFLLQEAVIQQNVSYVIDGHLNRDFYTQEELEELQLTECRFLPFGLLRTNCFQLIKGKKTPSFFKFVFLLSPENLRNTLKTIGSNFTVNDVSGIFINLKYQNNLLTLTTGVSYTIFSPDKSLEQQWDILVQRFLRQNQISFDVLSF